jgi:hypothetical protein
MSKEMPYLYFVSFAHPQGFGSDECQSAKLITTSKQINILRESIMQKNGYSGVVILNYVFLRKDDQE